jgi:hypothetical protein
MSKKKGKRKRLKCPEVPQPDTTTNVTPPPDPPTEPPGTGNITLG